MAQLEFAPTDRIPTTPPPADDGRAIPYARWTRRVVGTLLDTGLLAGVSWLTLGPSGGIPPFPFPLVPPFPLLPGDIDPHQISLTRSWALVATLAVILGLQARTGWSPGKLVVGIAVVRDSTGRPLGILRTVARWLWHLADTILMIGYLRPLWHHERRTFADSAISSVVVRRRPTGLTRGARFMLTAAATVVCLLGVGLAGTLTYTSAGRHLTQPCVPTAPAGTSEAVASRSGANVSGVEVRTVERRLWMTRITGLQRNYLAHWTWEAATVPIGDLALELTATSPSGQQVNGHVGIEGRSAESTLTEASHDGTGLVTAQVSIDDGAATHLGPVVDLTVSFLVDGQVAATCTVEDFAPPLD